MESTQYAEKVVLQSGSVTTLSDEVEYLQNLLRILCIKRY